LPWIPKPCPVALARAIQGEILFYCNPSGLIEHLLQNRLCSEGGVAPFIVVQVKKSVTKKSISQRYLLSQATTIPIKITPTLSKTICLKTIRPGMGCTA